MNKKKEAKRLQKKKRIEEMKNIVRKGKCLKCGRLMVKNHKSCHRCRKKRRLEAKANNQGRKKDHYTMDRVNVNQSQQTKRTVQTGSGDNLKEDLKRSGESLKVKTADTLRGSEAKK